jgi:hypothetical protein
MILKLRKVNKNASLVVTIPAGIIHEKGLKAGDYISIPYEAITKVDAPADDKRSE